MPNIYRIGVDVGGTNTDSVLFCSNPKLFTSNNRGILGSYKCPTTPVVSDGIETAIRALLHKTSIDPKEVTSVMIGNAVVEADTRRLSRVAVIRLGAPYTQECPPFLDFPKRLRKIMEGHVAILKGGLEIDGKLINDISEKELITESTKIQQNGIKAVAIVGIYSPLDRNDGNSQEERSKVIMSRILGSNVDIVCSRHVGQVGLLERENATILNASIMGFARRTILGFQSAMKRLGLSCPLFLTQNDGTLTTAEAAAKLPVRTFSSGATNSMRGAAYLAGLGNKDHCLVKNADSNIIVVDVGGTTTDIGVLLPSGFPRQAAAFIKVGGVRTNFSMPDVFSIGLGGGSRVHIAHNSEGNEGIVTVGPDSTGYKLLEDGLVFGGSTLTATDIVVADNPELTIGNPSKVTDGIISESVVRRAKEAIRKLLEDVIDRMKTSPGDATVLLVGGGSIICPDKLAGVGELIHPPFFSCANAVGACVANVSGELDTIEILQDRSLGDFLERCKKEAITRAVKAGAKEDTVRVTEIDILPVQYVTNKATRVIVKAIGELDTISMDRYKDIPDTYLNVFNDPESEEGERDVNEAEILESDIIDAFSYIPKVTETGEWILSEVDLAWIADGCGILGTGGGGSPYPPFIMARQILRDGGTIRVIAHDALPDNAIVFRGHFMGSPSVSNERLQAGTEIETACKNLAKFMDLGVPAAIISDEIGGGNGIQPMILASEKHLNVPIFDGDLMGRAYPNMWQVLPAAYESHGILSSLTPCAIADGVGNALVLSSTSNQYMVETILRSACTDMGSKAGVSMAPLSAKICREYGVIKSVSQAWHLGRVVAQERQRNNVKGIPEAILKLQDGKVLFTGKIIDVQREVRAGFTWGTVTMMPLSNDEQEQTSDLFRHVDDRLLITFQNENLIAELFDQTNGTPKQLLAVVPDLISVLDSQSGSSLGTNEYRYGLRVTVIALAGTPLWTTPEGLKNGGPAAFGLPNFYRSVGTYIEPRSVIEEFRSQRG